MSTQGGRLAATVAAGLIAWTALSGCGTERPGGSGHPAGTGTVSATKLGFTEHRGAVQYPAAPEKGTQPYVAPGQGLQHLVPLGSCVLAVGTYANGYRNVPVNWTGDASCTRLRLDPAPGSAPGGDSEVPYSMRTGWLGGGLPGDAVVPLADGSVLGISGSVVRRDAAGGIHELADLHLVTNNNPADETADDSAVSTAAVVGSRLLIGGVQTIDQTVSPFLFSSDDGGTTVRRQTLPSPAGGGPARTGLGELGVHGREVVGYGRTATNAYDGSPSGSIPFWHSSDAGLHWTAGELAATPPGTIVNGVLYADGRWLAYGGYAKPGSYSPVFPLLLTSTDGVHWTRTDTKAMGGGQIVAGTLDRAGHAVLVGSLTVPRAKPESRQTYCGAVWTTATRTTWHRGDLDCSEDPPTAATTLPDGRVFIAGNSTFWSTR